MKEETSLCLPLHLNFLILTCPLLFFSNLLILFDLPPKFQIKWTLSLPSSTAACSLKLLIRFLNIYMCIHTHMHILPMPQSEFPSWSHILGGNLWEHILIMILTMGIAGMWQTNKRNSGNHFGQGGIFKENVSSNFLLNHTIWVVTFSYWQNFLPY